jgi:hypothetical protein
VEHPLRIGAWAEQEEDEEKEVPGGSHGTVPGIVKVGRAACDEKADR